MKILNFLMLNFKIGYDNLVRTHLQRTGYIRVYFNHHCKNKFQSLDL